MIQRLLETVVNISPSEYARVSYAWALRFFFRIGIVLGGTSIIAIAVARYSVQSLPVILLTQAVLTVVGMLAFSALVERFSAYKLLALAVSAAMLCLLGSIFFYTDTILFLCFSLTATGLFMSQISIFLSNYLEDFFSPNEAIRALPIVESAETIGGIVAGLLLVSSFFITAESRFFVIWMVLLAVFLAILVLAKPQLPFFLRYIDEQSRKMVNRADISLNGLKKGISELSKVPFLQVLSLVVLFQWMIYHFIDFQYTKAVEGYLVAEGSLQSHEAVLTHGLGSLQILFHGSALLIEFVVAGRLLKFFGTFGGFLLHAIMTFLGVLSLLFGFGYFTAVLTRNNFEMSSIVYKNSYESAYYAFKYGTQRSLREYYEGLIYPVATIIATLLILLIQGFFIEAHFTYVAELLLIFFVILKAYFAFHVQKRYTDIAVDGLASDVPLARYHAVEILGQRGHRNGFELLSQALDSVKDDDVLRKKIYDSMSRLGEIRAISIYLRDFSLEDPMMGSSIIRAFIRIYPLIKKKCLSAELVKRLSDFFQASLDLCTSTKLQIDLVRALDLYDTKALEKYLSSDRPAVKAQVISSLWNYRKYHQFLKKQVLRMMQSRDRGDFVVLSLLSHNVRDKGLKAHVSSYLDSDSSELRLYASFALVRRHHYAEIDSFVRLLLHGNALIFETGLELIETLDFALKRRIAKSIQHEHFQKLLTEERGSTENMLQRLRAIYDACDASDELSFIRTDRPQAVLIN